jgi:hypothetical protein
MEACDEQSFEIFLSGPAYIIHEATGTLENAIRGDHL